MVEVPRRSLGETFRLDTSTRWVGGGMPSRHREEDMASRHEEEGTNIHS